MYGDIGVVTSSMDYPLLSQKYNAATKFFVTLHSSDRFITVATVANVCALIWLAVLAFWPGSQPSPKPAATQPG